MIWSLRLKRSSVIRAYVCGTRPWVWLSTDQCIVFRLGKNDAEMINPQFRTSNTWKRATWHHMKKKHFKGNVFTCIWAAATRGLVSFMLWILGFFEDQNWLNGYMHKCLYMHTHMWDNWEFIWLAYMSHAWLLHNGLSKSCSVQVTGYLSSLRC